MARKMGNAFSLSAHLWLTFPHRSPNESTLSGSEDETEDSASESGSEYGSKRFAFPELDDKIRQAVSEYGAVFPKLNFSSPRVSAPPPHSLANAY